MEVSGQSHTYCFTPTVSPQFSMNRRVFRLVLTKWRRTNILICQNWNFGSNNPWSKSQNFSHSSWSRPTDDSSWSNKLNQEHMPHVGAILTSSFTFLKVRQCPWCTETRASLSPHCSTAFSNNCPVVSEARGSVPGLCK